MPELDTIKGGKFDTVICRQAADKEFLDLPSRKYSASPVERLLAVVKKTTIAIDPRIDPLLKDLAENVRREVGSRKPRRASPGRNGQATKPA